MEKIANDPSIVIKSNDEIESAEEDWNTLTILAETLTSTELIDTQLPNEQLLYRLFNSTSVSIGSPKPLSYGCRCSRSRLENILKTFSQDDLHSMSENGNITMTCEFCRYDFIFPRTEIIQ